MPPERPRELAAKAIAKIPGTATWKDVLKCVSKAAAQSIPENVFIRAVEVLGSERNAIHWLLDLNIGLGGVSPISLIEAGKVDAVLNSLGMIEYGVYG